MDSDTFLVAVLAILRQSKNPAINDVSLEDDHIVLTLDTPKGYQVVRLDGAITLPLK